MSIKQLKIEEFESYFGQAVEMSSFWELERYLRHQLNQRVSGYAGPARKLLSQMSIGLSATQRYGERSL
jgi:hypothetical protein